MPEKTGKRKNKIPQLNKLIHSLDSISDGVFFLDRNWCYTYINERSASNLRLKPEDFIGQNIWEKIPQLKGTELELKYRQVMQDGQPQQFETRSIFTDRWYNVRVYPSKDGISVYLLDITERKKAEEALARAKNELEAKVKERTAELTASEEKYRSFIETTNEGIMLINPEGIITFANKKQMDMLGYEAGELIGQPVSCTIDGEYRELIKNKLENRKRGIQESYELKCRRKDGSPLWTILNVSPLYNSQGEYIGSLGMHTNITQQKMLTDQLASYAKRITQVQEEERKRIAYELHDDTAQYLSLLKLQLDSIIHSGEIRSPKLLEKLKYLQKDAGRAVDDIRRYSHELRPGVLEHLGIQAALEQIAEDINKLGQITVEVNVEGEEQELSEEIKLGFFRISQEALNNCRKHAQTSKCTISLKFLDNRMEMAVSDNGVGFDVQEAATRFSLKGSLGLMSMQERAKLIGADLKIESKPGEGTTVRAEISI